jgi:hypothetical protein
MILTKFILQSRTTIAVEIMLFIGLRTSLAKLTIFALVQARSNKFCSAAMIAVGALAHQPAVMSFVDVIKPKQKENVPPALVIKTLRRKSKRKDRLNMMDSRSSSDGSKSYQSFLQDNPTSTRPRFSQLNNEIIQFQVRSSKVLRMMLARVFSVVHSRSMPVLREWSGNLNHS